MKTESMLIYAVPDNEEALGFHLELVPKRFQYFMHDCDVMVGATDVHYSEPDDMSMEQLQQKAIETMRDKQKQILAQAQMSVNKLQEKINDLLQISYQPTTDDNVVILKSVGGKDDDIPF